MRCLHAWAAVSKHGLQVLLNNRPEATTALLMQLCTPGDSSKSDGDWIAKVSDFAHLAADRCAVLLPALPRQQQSVDVHCHKEKQGFWVGPVEQSCLPYFGHGKSEIWCTCTTSGVVDCSVLPQPVMCHSISSHSSTAQHSTAQHSTAQLSSAQHSSAQLSPAQRSREDACQVPHIGFQNPIAVSIQHISQTDSAFPAPLSLFLSHPTPAHESA